LSGAEVALRVAYVHAIKDGQGVRWGNVRRRDDALEGAGLTE
jgi:hypothetical protein